MSAENGGSEGKANRHCFPSLGDESDDWIRTRQPVSLKALITPLHLIDLSAAAHSDSIGEPQMQEQSIAAK
jgi:hypothetical protein